MCARRRERMSDVDRRAEYCRDAAKNEAEGLLRALRLSDLTAAELIGMIVFLRGAHERVSAPPTERPTSELLTAAADWIQSDVIEREQDGCPWTLSRLLVADLRDRAAQYAAIED
jgi:hypothetical protein